MEIIQRTHIAEAVERIHAFSWADMPGAGFAFDVDDDGQIVVTDGNRHNVEICLAGQDANGVKIIDEGIEERRWTYRVPSIGRCSCGEEVTLDHFTNTCDCGRDYNSSGQLLAPRSQWGEETGESLGDILRIP